MVTGEPGSQLGFDREPEPFLWFVYAPDGRLLDVIDVDACPGGWHEASLWGYLVAHADRQRRADSSDGLQALPAEGQEPRDASL